jgi:DeoR/GlpR family transcriptional regulator of sugar metabolism
MNLNIPDTRQTILEQRLVDGKQIVAIDVAQEFAVSLDTIRRDILALEAAGKARRVRGGAVPVPRPMLPLHTRLSMGPGPNPVLILAAIEQVREVKTLLLDGGSTTLALACRLPSVPGRLVITPSPWIAVACQENGIEVFMLGGKLSASGGIGVGDITIQKIASVSADVAILGACGLDADFGLSSDEFDEARIKKAMQQSARRTLVLADSSKIGRRARHQTLSAAEIDLVITDATEEQTNPLRLAGVEVTHA